jgi:hypothetical protein
VSARFVKELAERAARTFIQAYLSIWMVSGTDFDSLFQKENWQAGIVAVALSVGMSLGLKNVGPNKNSASAV